MKPGFCEKWKLLAYYLEDLRVPLVVYAYHRFGTLDLKLRLMLQSRSKYAVFVACQSYLTKIFAMVLK